jgi:hypothetical protein
VLCSLLVHICLAVVRLFIHLIAIVALDKPLGQWKYMDLPDGVAGSLGTGGEGSVGVLGDALVGLLAGCSTTTLDGLGDVVGCVLFEIC